MTDRGYAIVLPAVLSILLSIVQTALDSKISNGKSYFTLPSGLYNIIMTFGNILSTLLAAGLTRTFKR
jgi:hypothetical protein